ncbi:STN domain-containing protein [Thalassoglobus neptunius]|uniref:STN domain-containing protein n=1 Tax=Thalassoglobus neptunius TaxID=1938619 RepID=UPI001E291C4F|nr:STN domain-containing protein [Thalassoglobus neptunius]
MRAIYRLLRPFPSCECRKQVGYGLILLLIASISIGQAADRTNRRLRTDAAFQEVLDHPLLSSSARKREIQPFLNQLASERDISILIDRRIDPHRPVSATLREDYFDDGIRKIAAEIGAEVTVVADTILVGPPGAIRKLRTRIAILDAEFRESDGSPLQKLQTLRESTLTWDDFTRPRELIQQVASKYRFTVTNPEAIPHDLWRSGSISDGDLIDQLVILLSQFDLTFRWGTDSEIEIVPELEELGVWEDHHHRTGSLAEAMALLKESQPDINVEVAGDSLRVLGTVESHEQVAVMLGERPPRVRPPSQLQSDSIENQRFTLQMVRKPFRSLVQLLEQQGLEFQFDEDHLRECGVDLNQKVSVNVEQVSAEELLRQASQPLGLQIRIDGRVIELFVEE